MTKSEWGTNIERTDRLNRCDVCSKTDSVREVD